MFKSITAAATALTVLATGASALTEDGQRYMDVLGDVMLGYTAADACGYVIHDDNAVQLMATLTELVLQEGGSGEEITAKGDYVMANYTTLLSENGRSVVCPLLADALTTALPLKLVGQVFPYGFRK